MQRYIQIYKKLITIIIKVTHTGVIYFFKVKRKIYCGGIHFRTNFKQLYRFILDIIYCVYYVMLIIRLIFFVSSNNYCRLHEISARRRRKDLIIYSPSFIIVIEKLSL